MKCIKGGLVVDGTGVPGFRADVYVEGDRIILVDRSLAAGVESGKVVDAAGMVVCPGFIDAHTHSDLRLLSDPVHEGKIRQGVTTELIGLDGVSYAPASDADLAFYLRYFAPINGGFDGRPAWNEVDEYLALFDRRVSVNVGYLLPHGNARLRVMGHSGKQASPAELSEMCKVVEDGMEQGAIGISTGLVYYPCPYSDTEELVALARVAGRRGGIFVTHMRKNSNPLASLEETVEIARRSGTPVHISHFRPSAKKEEQYGLLERAAREGLDISYDCYPYPSSCTALWVALPHWLLNTVAPAQFPSALAEAKTRNRLKTDMASFNWDGAMVLHVGSDRRDLEGKSIAQLAEERDTHPVDACCDLLIKEDLDVLCALFNSCEQDVLDSFKSPTQMFGSDGILVGRHSHPRAFGAFARVLGKYVREEGALSLEEAIRKMTSLPAKRFNLDKRGVLAEGCFADIAVFDAKTVGDTNTFSNPWSLATGFMSVINNGRFVIDNGRLTNETPGRVVRSQKTK